MERQRLDSIRREGQAYGYGMEIGHRKAISNYYERKRAEEEWRRDPLGFDRARKFAFGDPSRRKKRRH